MTADDDQAASMPAWESGDHVIGGSGGTAGVNAGVKADLQSGNGTVLGEELVAGGGDALVGPSEVGAGLAGAEALQGLGRIEDAGGIDLAHERADFRVGGEAGVGSKAEEQDR